MRLCCKANSHEEHGKIKKECLETLLKGGLEELLIF